MFARSCRALSSFLVLLMSFWITGCLGLKGATSTAPGAGSSSSGSPSSGSPSSSTPVPPPTIQASATPSTITAGQSSMLTWSSTGADTVTIDSIGSVATNGSKSVSPAQTTNYKINATGHGGTASASLTITVTAQPPTPPPPPTGNANVPTWHMDNGRSGLNDHETVLTPAGLTTGHFGKLFSYIVDGYLYAQPLYVSSLNIRGSQAQRGVCSDRIRQRLRLRRR